MLSFADNVARFCEREQLFRRVKNVLVAVSGGADSTACLLTLVELRERFGFEVTAVHFDHQLRPGSAADMAVVRDMCDRLGVACLSGEGDVRGFARQRKMGIEEAARRMRYQFLAFVAAEKRSDCIATGHTADDQAETILMRILRGSGVRGVRGMLPSAPLPGAPAMRLIRPLLATRRADTEAFCATKGIAPLEDPSNRDVAMTRNHLRLETLPALEAINPSVRQALLGLAQSARELFVGIERASYGAQPVARTPVGAIFEASVLAALPNEALTLVIEREAGFFKLQPEVNRTRIENLRVVLSRQAGEVRFGDVAVQVSCGKARLGPPLAGEPFAGTILNVPGATAAGRWRVELSSSELAPREGASLAKLDVDSVQGVLRIRAVQPGDRIRYHGIERKVADLFANAKVPAWERLGVVAVADSARVHLLFTATTTFEADRSPAADVLRLRLTATN